MNLPFAKFTLQEAIIIAICTVLILQPQFPLAIIAVAAFIHQGWAEWLAYKTPVLDPYVRKIELLQEDYRVLLEEVNAQKDLASQLAEVQSKVAQLGMQVATRTR